MRSVFLPQGTDTCICNAHYGSMRGACVLTRHPQRTANVCANTEYLSTCYGRWPSWRWFLCEKRTLIAMRGNDLECVGLGDNNGCFRPNRPEDFQRMSVLVSTNTTALSCWWVSGGLVSLRNADLIACTHMCENHFEEVKNDLFIFCSLRWFASRALEGMHWWALLARHAFPSVIRENGQRGLGENNLLLSFWTKRLHRAGDDLLALMNNPLL